MRGRRGGRGRGGDCSRAAGRGPKRVALVVAVAVAVAGGEGCQVGEDVRG